MIPIPGEVLPPFWVLCGPSMAAAPIPRPSLRQSLG